MKEAIEEAVDDFQQAALVLVSKMTEAGLTEGSAQSECRSCLFQFLQLCTAMYLAREKETLDVCRQTFKRSREQYERLTAEQDEPHDGPDYRQ